MLADECGLAVSWRACQSAFLLAGRLTGRLPCRLPLDVLLVPGQPRRPGGAADAADTTPAVGLPPLLDYDLKTQAFDAAGFDNNTANIERTLDRHPKTRPAAPDDTRV